jgi:hypothetical protein
MWKSLFELLGKTIDLARDLLGRKKATQSDEESAKVEGSETEEIGRASGKAAYEASKLVGPKKST